MKLVVAPACPETAVYVCVGGGVKMQMFDVWVIGYRTLILSEAVV